MSNHDLMKEIDRYLIAQKGLKEPQRTVAKAEVYQLATGFREQLQHGHKVDTSFKDSSKAVIAALEDLNTKLKKFMNCVQRCDAESHLDVEVGRFSFIKEALSGHGSERTISSHDINHTIKELRQATDYCTFKNRELFPRFIAEFLYFFHKHALPISNSKEPDRLAEQSAMKFVTRVFDLVGFDLYAFDTKAKSSLTFLSHQFTSTNDRPLSFWIDDDTEVLVAAKKVEYYGQGDHRFIDSRGAMLFRPDGYIEAEIALLDRGLNHHSRSQSR